MVTPGTHTLLKARFGYVRKALESTMIGLSDDLLHWAPGEGMRTVHGQLFEIAGKEVELLTFAKAKGHEDWVEVESFGEGEKTIEGWKSILAGIRTDTLGYLDSLSETDLNELVAFPEDDWWEGLHLRAVPLHEIFRNVAAHEWYHTGQLISYLWSRGANPYET